MKDFGKTAKKEGVGPMYELLNNYIDDDVLDALIFIFFCSAFFGYLIAKTSLTIISVRLNMWGIPVPDLGSVIPNLIQITLALVIVLPFLLINVFSLRKKLKKSKSGNERKWRKKMKSRFYKNST